MTENFVNNPEFLREDHALTDFISSELIIFGGHKKSSKILADFYKNYTKCVCTEYIYTDVLGKAGKEPIMTFNKKKRSLIWVVC